MPDTTDELIKGVQRIWAAQEADAVQRRAERKAERLQRYRDKFLSGTWKPSVCSCHQCCRCVVEMSAPEGLCARGQRNERFWE